VNRGSWIAITDPATVYVERRAQELHEALTTVDRLAADSQLPDAAIEKGRLKVKPLENAVPDAVADLMRSAYPTLEPLIGARLDTKLITRYWEELLRLATSIKQGTVIASTMLRKLGAYPRQNQLAASLREVGRLDRTLFTLGRPCSRACLPRSCD
jgi:hypothetical protein